MLTLHERALTELFQRADMEGRGESSFKWLREARACARLRLKPSSGRVGASRFGGEPDLPAGVPWPSVDGEGLVFLQQLNLAEIRGHEALSESPSPLPGRGLLSMFLRHDDMAGPGGGEFHLLYHDAPVKEFRRVSAPEKMVPSAEDYGGAKPFDLEAVWAVDLPMSGPGFEHAIEEGDDEFDLWDFRRLERDLACYGDREAYGGSLFGHPYGVQSDQVASAVQVRRGLSPKYLHQLDDELRTLIKAEREDWVPLWLIESNFRVGLSFWDAGSFGTYIHRDDLSAQDFARAYTELESS